MDNKALLLEIGLNHFSRLPYEAVSVQEIVAEAGVTKPTLYHYFGSKLGLYEAVFELHAVPFFEMMRSKAVWQNDLVNHLNETAQAAMIYFKDHPKSFWLLEHAMNVDEHAEHASYVSVWWRSLNELIDALFEQAVVQHGNLKGKTSLVSNQFVFVLRGAVEGVLSGRIAWRDDLGYQVVRLFMHGIFA